MSANSATVLIGVIIVNEGIGKYLKSVVDALRYNHLYRVHGFNTLLMLDLHK